MKNWKITLKFPDGTTDELELHDGASILRGYLTIKSEYFNEIIKKIKEQKRFISGKAIETVIGPDDEDWTNNPWLLFIIKDNEKQTPFWFLFKRENDLNGILVAIGPEKFAEYLKSSGESDINVKKLLYYFTAYAEKWSNLVLLPNYLA